MRPIDHNSSDQQRMERHLVRRFTALTSQERSQVINILEELAATDEILADLRIGLTSVTVEICFIDQSPCRMLSYIPSDLLKMFHTATENQTKRFIRLVID